MFTRVIRYKFVILMSDTAYKVSYHEYNSANIYRYCMCSFISLLSCWQSVSEEDPAMYIRRYKRQALLLYVLNNKTGILQ